MDPRAFAALLFTVAVWGVGPVFMRTLSTALGPADHLAIRYTIVSLVYAALLALGLYGIENQIDPGEPFSGNGYLTTDHPRVPASLSEAITAWEESHLPALLFGGVAARHYLHAARLEQDSFDEAVTDWERRRYFERG